jgi:hypothetical protein
MTTQIVDGLVAELEAGEIESVAFVVRCDAASPLPLYDAAIATARRGWRLGVPRARYWLITPEACPPATAYPELGPEGIEFVGSTYADLMDDVLVLDPRDESIRPDRVVSLGSEGEVDITRLTHAQPSPPPDRRAGPAA